MDRDEAIEAAKAVERGEAPSGDVVIKVTGENSLLSTTEFVYMNAVSKVWHKTPECHVAKRTRYLQKTLGDGSNILHGIPCMHCARTEQ